MHRLTVMKELSKMWNRYQPHRRGIRFFPHIIPIAFPLIFPLGFGLAFWLFHALFSVLGILLLIALAFFIYRAITLGSTGAAWNSMKNTGNQWQQRFTSAAHLPVTTALLPAANTSRTTAVITALWAGLPARAAYLPSASTVQ